MEENRKQNNKKEEKLETLQTYMSDMADVVRDKEMSIAKIASAEQKNREEGNYYHTEKKSSKNKLVFLIGGIILILIAVFVSYLLIQKTKEKNKPPKVITVVKTLISYDSKATIDVTNATNNEDLSKLINPEIIKKGAPQSIKEISLIEQVGDSPAPLSLNNLFSLLNTTAPGSLLRAFSGNYMLGTYTPLNNYEATHLFLIIKIGDYDLAYAGMLKWEKTMFNDLFYLFHLNISSQNNISKKPFNDIVIKNRDARVLYNEKGVPKLFYLFPNKNTLVISDSRNAIKEILSRLLIKETKPI